MILLPSYNRAKLLTNFFKAYRETEGSAPGMVLVDKDDPQLDMYKGLPLPPGWRLRITTARRMGDKFREVFNEVKDLEWVGILNDDHVPKTKNWDQITIGQVKGHNIIGTNDNWRAPQKICGFIVLSGQVIRTLGWIIPPGIQHLFSDDVWEFLAGHVHCGQILMDVVVEHDHAYKDETKKDQTYNEVNSKESWEEDKKGFEAWMQTSSHNDVQNLVAIQPKTGVMLATPFHDKRCAVGFQDGCFKTGIAFVQRSIWLEHAKIEGSSLLAHARNTLVDMFLKSRCQKLLFIDSDEGFQPEDVLMLLNSSRRVICGVVPHKRFPINLNFEPLDEHQHCFKDLANKSIEEFVTYTNKYQNEQGEIEVKRAGTGFMMVDRSVFEIIKDDCDTYLPFDFRSDVKHHEYFRMGIHDENRYRGEDWFFTEKVKKHQIPIYINARVLVSHVGDFNFSLTGR